jgi:hypothetical protein
MHVCEQVKASRIVQPSWFDADKRSSSPTNVKWNALLILWHGSSFPRLERHLCEFRNPIAKKHRAQSSHSGSLIHFKMIGLGDLHFGDPLGTLKSGRLQPYFLRSALSFTSSDLCFTHLSS